MGALSHSKTSKSRLETRGGVTVLFLWHFNSSRPTGLTKRVKNGEIAFWHNENACQREKKAQNPAECVCGVAHDNIQRKIPVTCLEVKTSKHISERKLEKKAFDK